jgi:hypothetical protein
MSGTQSPERISGKAYQESSRLNSLLKNNELITTQNERDEIRFIEDRVGKDIVDAVKTPSNISPQQILSTALRPLFLEGSYRSYEVEQDRKMEVAKGRGRNFLQNTSRWVTSTVGKTFESTYMGLAHGAEAAINFGAKKIDKGLNWSAKKIGKEEWAKSNIASFAGSDNMVSLMKLTGDIFSDSEKYGSEDSIKSELRSRIISMIMSGRAKIENKTLGVNIDTDLLTGEGSQLALALSEFGPFNKNTDQVLEAVKNADQPKFASKIDYVLEKLYKQIEVARFNEAEINGVEDSIEANLLSDIIEIQDKLKATGTTGARETFNFARFAAGLGLGTLTTTVNLVKTAAGSNLGENQRLQKIKAEVVESREFIKIGEQIQNQVEAGTLDADNAKKLAEQALNRIAYNTYLEVVKEAIKVNKETTAKLTMTGFVGGVKSFINNAIDQGFAASNIQALAGYGVSEQELQQIIIANNKANAEFNAEQLDEGAIALYKSVEKFSIIPTDGTQEFAEKIRKQQIEITDNGFAVAAKLGTEILKQTRDGAVAMVASTPYVAGAGALTYSVTGGNFGFSVDKADASSGFSGDRNIIQSRFDKGLGLNGGDMSGGDQAWNASMNLLARANGTGNVANALLMPFTALDNVTGRHVQGGISTGIENVKTAGSRVAEFSARVASSTWMDVQKSVVHTFTTGDIGYTTESTLPQPSGVDNLVAQAANVAKGGTDNFSVGQKVNLNLGNTTLNSDVIGKVTDTGLTVFRPDLKGVTVKSEFGSTTPVLYDATGNKINTGVLKPAYLMEIDNDGKQTGNLQLGPDRNPVVVLVQGDNIQGALQLSADTMGPASAPSSTPQPTEAINNSAKPTLAKPEAAVVTPANSSAKPNLNNSTTGSLLSGNATIGGSDKTAADRINASSNGSSFVALDELRNRTGNAFQTVFNTPNNETASATTSSNSPAEPTTATKPTAEQAGNTQASNAGGLKINVNNSSNNFNIYNNADLAATLGNGEYNSGISRQVLQEVIRQSNLADLQSRGTVQRLAYLAENKLPLPPELKGLTLSSGAKADAVYEGFVQNPDQAKNALAGVSSNANVATEIRTENTGKFMVLPVAGGLMANAERTWDELVQTITISSISTTGGDPTIALPNNAQESNANTGVKVENGIISARLGIDFKPLSKISLNLGNGINAIVDATQFPKLMDQLNSGKEVKLSDLLRNVATVNPEVAKAVGAIDTTKAVASNVLDIRAKDGKVVNLFEAIYKTRGLFNVVTDASGNVINSNNIGSSTQDNNILGPALKTLMNATPEQKIAFLKGIKEYNGKFLGPDTIATLSDAERAKWTLNRLFEQRNPGILKQDVITNEDLFKLGSGLNFSGTKVLEANLKEDVLKAFKHNTTLHPNTVPAQILLNINNQNNTLAQTIKYIEDAEKYVRGQNRDRMPSGWRPFLRDDISSRLRDIAVVQQAMGEKPADITRDHTYEGTIGFGGPGYKEKAFYNLYNLNYLPKEASQNFFKANEENPQVTSIAQRAYSNIMGIGIDGVRTGPLVNKLAVAVLSQFVPLSFAFSMEEKTTNNQSFYNLSPQDLASAETVTALAIKFTDPEYAKAYAKFISEKHTPEESLILALGAKPDASTGKWVVEGRNGFKQTFDSIDELNKFSKMARASVMKVESAESVNASSSAGVKVFENNPVASVELGGSTLTAKESEELKQYLGNEAKNYEDNMVKARKMLVEAQANREKVAATLTATFTANSIREAMGLGTNGFLATHGEYKGGNKDGVISSTDNSTEAKANPDDVKRYKTELDEYRSGIRSSLPDPVMAYLIKCKNFTPIFGQDIPLTTSGEISTSGNTETDLNVQRNVKKGAEDVAMGVKPPKNNEEPPKKEEPKKPKEPEKPKTPEEQNKDLTGEANQKINAPASKTPGANPNNPQGTGSGVEVKAPTPANAPGSAQLPVQPSPNAQNIAAPTTAVQQPPTVQVAPAPQVAQTPVVPAPSVTTSGFEAAQSTSQATQVISQPAAQATQNVTQEVVTQQAQQQVAQEVVQNQAIELTTTGGAPLVAEPLRPIADSVR